MHLFNIFSSLIFYQSPYYSDLEVFGATDSDPNSEYMFDIYEELTQCDPIYLYISYSICVHIY